MKKYTVLALVIAAIAATAVPSSAQIAEKYRGFGGLSLTDQVDLDTDEVVGLLPQSKLGTGIQDAKVVDNLTISGGTVNNSPVGAFVPSTGAFTTGSFSGLLTTAASVAGGAKLVLTPGVAPTSPTDGMVWLTAAGLFYQANGSTYQAGGSGGGGGIAGYQWELDGTDLVLTDGINVLARFADAGTTGNFTSTGRLTAAGLGTFTTGIAITDFEITDIGSALTITDGTNTMATITDAGTTGNFATTGTLTAAGASALGGDVTLDDGSGASPSLIFQDETNETATFSKADSGYLSLTTLAADGLSVLTGNFKVGAGTPDVALNGVDAYVTGTFEADGATRLDGAVTATSTLAVTGTALFAGAIGVGDFRASDTGTDLVVTDGVNTLFTLADGGTVGNASLTGTLAVTGATTLAGALTLDDGVTASPDFILKDATDETATFSKADSGYLSLTTLAADGLSVLVGNFKVGAGTPDLALNGVDIYGSGTLEIDGATRLDGTVAANSTVTVADTLQVNEEVAIDLDANDEEVDITTTAADYAADSALLTLYNNAATGQTNNFYGLRIRNVANADAQEHYIVCETNNGTDVFTVNAGGNTTVGGTLSVTGTFAPTTLTLSPFVLGVDAGVLEVRDGADNNMFTVTDNGTTGTLGLGDGTLAFTGYKWAASAGDLILTDGTNQMLSIKDQGYSAKVSAAIINATSNFLAGTDDITEGYINLYGSSTAQGGSVLLFNGAVNDSTVDYWILQADSGDLKILTSSGLTALSIDDVTTSATFSGKVITPASAAVAGASLNVPHGIVPNTPVNGDVYSTTAGFYGYVNGGWVGPFEDSTMSDLTIDGLFKLDTDTGVFEFTDGTNNMFTVTDNGTTGTLAVSGSLSVAAGNLTVAAITDVASKISRDQAITTGDLLELETTNALDDHAALLVDANSTGAVDAVEIEVAGTAAGLHITTGAAAGTAIDIDVADAMTGRLLYGDLGPWVGTNSQGAIEIITDSVATAPAGSLALLAQCGTGQHATAIEGSVLYIADEAAAPVAGTSYTVSIDATSIEALHVDTGLSLFDEKATFTGGIDVAGTTTFDDGVTASPDVVFKDATDETATFSKADSGYLTITTVAGDGVSVRVGNLTVGDGAPTVALDGEDLYVNGTAEVDGAARFDGTVDVYNNFSVYATTDLNGDVNVDLAANTHEVTIRTTAADYGAGASMVLFDNNTAGQTNNFYLLNLQHQADGDAQDHFLKCTDNSGPDVKFSVNSGGDVVTAGDLAVNGADVTSTAATVNLFNATTTKINLGGAAAIDLSGAGLATTVKGTFNVDQAVTMDTTLGVTGNISVVTAGKGLNVMEGANARQGVSGAMVAGTITISTTAVTATSRIFLTPQTLGTVALPAAVGVTARTVGVSFVITSGDATDTSTVAWEIFEPAA